MTAWESIGVKTRVRNLGIAGLLLFTLLIGVVPTAQAQSPVQFDCSQPPFNGVIDGNVFPVAPSNVKIDINCTIRNYPGGMSTNFNFDNNDPTPYLVIFDNVVHTGQMSCNAVADHKIWFTNGSSTSIQDGCQNALIPVEKIDKQRPAPFASIGVPFTYRLTIPVLFDPASGAVIRTNGSVNDLHTLTIIDDLNETGVSLSVVGTPTVTWLSSGAQVAHTYTNLGNVLTFSIAPIIPADAQIAIDITVVLNDTPTNVIGSQFINTARWSFGRAIDLDENGIIDPNEFFSPLPGENGIALPITIAAPSLAVDKTGTTVLGGTTINLGEWGIFTIDVVNQGNTDAWDVTILDQLPDGPTGGMCDLTPQVLSVTLAGSPLTQNVHYLLGYTGPPTCRLTLTLLDAAGPIGPNEHLVITYQSKLDANTQNGATLTNVAGSTQWFNDSSANTSRQAFTRVITNGTVGVVDHEDAHTLSVLLAGYFFEKTVRNVTTGANPALLAAPGDTLHYTLRLQSTTSGFTDVVFRDQLPADFVPGSLVVGPLPAGAVNNSDPATGLIDIRNIDVAAASEVRIEFDVTLLATVLNAAVVSNQAQLLSATGNFLANSDDPNVNGQANPDPAVADEDPTRVTISAPPAAPSKVLLSPATPDATIGQDVVYRIVVPSAARSSSLYDVQITDVINPNLEYVSASVTGGVGVTNTSTATQLNIGVTEISSGQQVVIELHARVRNVLAAQQGADINNTASYTYADVAGGTTYGPLSSALVALNIVEPHIPTITKVPDRTTVVGGDIVRYSLTLTAAGGVDSSDVFDVSLTDNLEAGLVYVGNATVSGGGNTIGAPVITGDGSAGNPQTLTWSLSGGNADIDIAEGTSITIAYDVQVLGTVLADVDLTNSVVAMWSGLDGPSVNERTGADGIGLLNDYVTAPATATVSTPGARPAKVLLSPATPEATIGQEVVYQITVPSSLSGTTLFNVQITDLLDTNLEYISATVSGVAGATNTSTATQMNIAIAQIPAGQQAVIELHARVRNVQTAQQGVVISNTVTYIYATVAGGSTQPPLTSAPVTLTIVEPQTTLAKTADRAAVSGGDIVRYTLTLTAPAGAGSADVFDVAITDTLSPGLVYAGNPVVTGAGNTIGAPGITGDGSAGNPQILVWSLSGANADIDISAGTSIAISYDVRVLNGVVALQPLANSATAHWTSLDGGSIYERTGAGCPTISQPNDYCTGPASHTVITDPPALTFEKTVLTGTTAYPGDVVRYRVQVTNTSNVTFSGFSLLDDHDALNSTAMFVPGTLTLVTALPIGLNNTTSTGGSKGTGLIDIGNLTLGPGGSANDTVTIEFTVRLAPVIANGTMVLNQAQITYGTTTLQQSDDPGLGGAQDPTRLVILSAPAFRVQKLSYDVTGDPNLLLAGDTLRYSITVKNIGNDNATDAMIRDQIPVNTTYVAGSTRLNGTVVTDVSSMSALVNGILIHAPENPTPGAMRADIADAANNVATLTFDVVVNSDVANGTIISNQAFVSAVAGGVVDYPSDDPMTPIANDPTRDIVGSLPLIYAEKRAVLQIDNVSLGVVDPGDVLRYTISVYNNGLVPATAATLRDAVPANTTYVANSVMLNGLPIGQPDGGISPLVAGIDISSSNLTPPLPIAGQGVLSPGAAATIEFDLRVNAGVPPGTLISNQATARSYESPAVLTDGDGNPATGPEPTVVVVGPAQQLSITKQVAVVGGGPAVAGATLEYVVRVTNIATLPAQYVVITDDLSLPMPGYLAYVDQSATLNGSTNGISVVGTTITADYSTMYGPLLPGGSIVLRFRAIINPTLAIGTRVTNTGVVTWNNPPQTASASVSIDVGGIVGFGILNGTVWHDADFDRSLDVNERLLEGWTVDLYRNDVPIRTTLTDVDGVYRISGLTPNYNTADRYELRFRAPGAGANTAMLGTAYSSFTNGLQRIWNILIDPGSNLLELDLPIDPNGVVYDSVARTPIGGANVAMLSAGSSVPLPASCFDDPSQQNQVTLADGYYKFDMNFSDPACPSGGNYVLGVTAPGGNYLAGYSQIVPPISSPSTAAFNVAACPGSINDAIAATAQNCEVTPSEFAPGIAVPARAAGTNYHVHLRLDGSLPPGSSQLFNNHLPIDPDLQGAIAITKTTPSLNVTRGQLVPYVITYTNITSVPLFDVSVIDRFPAGFRYVAGSARINGKPVEPTVLGRELAWNNQSVDASARHTLMMLLAVGAGVSEGEFVNRVQAVHGLTGRALSGEATATVRVVPDPTFDCTDVIGKVFDDANRNGRQDDGESGLSGVRLVTARGLAVTTDQYGRYHITCAVTPNEARGSNFVLKLDDRTLPSGYRPSTEPLRVQRATRGKALQIDFGASIYRVVSLDISDAVFEPGSSHMRSQWRPRITLLLNELRKSPATLRLSYLADLEDAQLVKQRVDAIQQEITTAWQALNCCYRLSIEQEIFWRLGAPPQQQGIGVSESRIGASVERHLSGDQPITQWLQDPQTLKNEAGDKLEVRQVASQEVATIKLKNVVPPIRFESGKANIPSEYVAKVRAALDAMKDRKNVRLHFVGHADNQPLAESLVRTYGDNAGLSRERAGEVAEFFKTRLSLPAEAIAYEWAGETQPIASNATAAGRSLNRRVEVEVWYDEIKGGLKNEEVLVAADIKRVKVCRVATVCKLRYQEGHVRRARVKNLVAPLHYEDETINVTAEFKLQIEQALHNLRDKGNVQVRFIGFADDAPLTGRNERIYGDHLSLSKARAHRVALAIQEALKLPTTAIASDGRGSAMPLALNNTAQGRATNRRVEVEFWHDDLLQELPDEPQMCPSTVDGEVVTKVYDPPWGSIAPLQLENGNAVIPTGYVENLRRAMTDVGDEINVRLRFVGYTKNERLERRTAEVYGDDIGLSAARARRAMTTIKEQMGLADAQVEHEGRGYVHSADVVNAGFTQGDTSHVIVQVVYDEPRVTDDLDGVDVTRLTRELRPKDPYGLNLMRISVDGKPFDDPGRSSADIQRCTDVALEKADIQFRFDNLESRPRLTVTASPKTVALGTNAATAHVQSQASQQVDSTEASQAEPALSNEPPAVNDESVASEAAVQQTIERSAPRFAGSPVRFRMYANYSSYIARAEVRIFEAGQSPQAVPLEVVPIDSAGFAEWLPTAQQVAAPMLELRYVLRAYDKNGNFDETNPQSLWLVPEQAASDTQVADATPADLTPKRDAELLASYGESALSVRNIATGSGTVKITGSGIPPNHTVWVAGRSAPVDASGSFVAEEVLPAGAHTVEVAVLDETGNGTLFLRDLEFKRNDWFYVGIADVTASEHSSNGPVDLLQGADAPTDYDSTVDGRLAFFVNGKFWENWKLTASADTREGPVEDLFSNFMNKSPESLFRRIDPDYYYPTFGDDSVVEELAPTMGKFYLKVSRDENYGMWGNFKVGYLANELAQVDRGLYGANVHYGSESTTGFGERRFMIDGFAAEPGTVPSREEFRGTGGSLYFLRRQDILTGSERIRIELRDKDSQIVTGVVNLRPGIDYDIDYLQGRVLLSEPLASTVDDNLLVRSGGLSGDEAYLVVRYEYTPGFEDLDAVSTGGQGHVWLTDFLKIGLTANANEDGDVDSNLNAADLTLRMSAESWLKVQAAQSEGLVSNSLYSNDGGFGFSGSTALSSDTDATAYRADLSIGVADLIKDFKGRLSFYTQTLEAGYSAPGLNTPTDTENYGGKFTMPVTEKLNVTAKADSRIQQDGLKNEAQELNVGYQLTRRWSVSAGVRNDLREDNSPLVPLTQDEGERTDAVMQVGYHSKKSWKSYAFVQETLSVTEEREENGRYGAGGSYRVTDRYSVDAEVSDGDLGLGARLGTNYQYSDRTNLYLNYSLETERTDNGLRGRGGNLISGVKRRISDSSSVYLEERYQDSDLLTGLTHATGVTLAPNERWNFGANADVGTLKDAQTGAETERLASGIRVGYGANSLQLSSAVEYRQDETELADLSLAERTTWLFRNNFKFQLTPDWRLLGKFDHAISESTLGEFYDGGYTEAVVGYGYRPVRHDRLDVLAKYTYFYNVPTTDQVTQLNMAAQFIQKSHIAALDVTYDLTSQWSVGGKYAYRKGQISLDRENPEFFDNRAQLYVLRTDWRFLQSWESLLEVRALDMPDLNETRSGALIGLYRYMGKHVKVGVGYNFTEFSDDLTDLSYDHRGAFINVVGTL